MPWDILDYEGRIVGDGAAYMPPIDYGWYNTLTGMITCSNQPLVCSNKIIPCISGWYDVVTGMIACSDKLLICNEDIIPCL